MKINEFIEYMAKNVNGTMKDEQILSLVKKQLEVKKYLPLATKKELIDEIIYKSAYYENGMLKFSNIDCYMYFTMLTIGAYTNLEIDNVEDGFDTLSASGMLPVVISAIGQDYNDVNTFLNMKRDEILEDNSLEAQVTKFFAEMIEKVEELSNVITKGIDGLDISKDDVVNLIQMFAQQ